MKHTSKASLIVAIFMVIAVGAFSTIRAHQAPDAAQIISRVEKTYASCKTYRDSGTLKNVIASPNGNFTNQGTFTTAFVGPDRFRFEYKEIMKGQEVSCIVWRKGQEISTWFGVTHELKKQESFPMALAEATGCSWTSAYHIPSLLFSQEFAGRLLTVMKEPARIEDAKLEQMDCYRIQGKKGSVTVTLWIDKNTHLVQRIDWKHESGSETTITYKPVLDGEVKDEVLEFNPPQQ